MKIFSAAQIREWDAYTVANEPIASLELMNRAASVFSEWLMAAYPDPSRPILLLCGTGNNGGDGLAVARMLDQAQFAAKVVVCDFDSRQSADFEAQLALIPDYSPLKPVFFKSFEALLEKIEGFLPHKVLLVDALFGTGLSRPLTGDWARLIAFLNGKTLNVASIDLPSGLFADTSSLGNPVMKAQRTLTFETPKRAFFLPENSEFLGEWAYRSIGLHPEFATNTPSPFHYLTFEDALALRRPRSKFSHKGSFGHALVIAGSLGKMGAAVLATKACLRAGAGLLSVHVPQCGALVLQTSVPEAMVNVDQQANYWAQVPGTAGYSSIGVGPGIGLAPETVTALRLLLQQGSTPMVLDADALNILAANPDLLKILPADTILTPHPKEFERLFGKTSNDFERLDRLRTKAMEHAVFIVLKGAHTAIACPDGTCWFNSTGNPGMATGGSGDVLTGMVTGLLAQGYPPQSSCLLGVYLHGLAGDLAAISRSQEAMIAGDLVEHLGDAWLQLS